MLRSIDVGGVTVIRASVVLDLSSLVHQAGDLDGDGRRANIVLKSLVRVLGARGYEVHRLLVAMATVPVATSEDSDVQEARRITRLNREWAEEQRQILPGSVELVILHGGHDGHREIGVDDLVVATTLLESYRIATGPGANNEVVLVVTHDGDMDHLAAYAYPVTVRMVGAYDKQTRRRLRRAKAPFDALESYELRNCRLDGPLLLDVAADDPSRVYGLVPKPIQTVSGSPTVAVVDAYGLACSAACALGVSRLPSVESLRGLLARLGQPKSSALLVTIPDIKDAAPADDQFTHLRNLAWMSRDSELDALADRIIHDDDDLTQVRRGFLNPERLPDELNVRLDRSGPTRAAKRVATQLTADLVSQVLAGQAQQIILITDSPHVVWIQALMVDFLGNGGPDILRIGLHAAPVVLITDEDKRVLPSGSFRVLNEDEVARLTRTKSIVGRELRARIRAELETSEPEMTSWTVVGFDPEIDGIRVRHAEDPSFEMLLADSYGLGLAPGRTFDIDSLSLELHFQPGLPTLFPVPSCREGNHGAAVRSYADVTVLERDGLHLHFDLDGDEVADGMAHMGHDFRPVGDLSSAVLGRLSADDREWYYVSVEDDSPIGLPVIVEVVNVDDSGVTASTFDERSELIGPLSPPPSCPPVQLAVGDRVWAVNSGSEGHGPTWIQLSSPVEV